MNTEKKIINKVKTLLGLEVKLEQMKLDNGAVLEAEAFEVDAEVLWLQKMSEYPCQLAST